MSADKIIYVAERMMVPATLIGCVLALVGAAIGRKCEPPPPRRSYGMSAVEFDGHLWIEGDLGAIVHHPDCKCRRLEASDE